MMSKDSSSRKMFRRLFGNLFCRFKLRNVTLLISVISILAVYQFTLYMTDTLETNPEAKQDLSGIWEVCIPSQPSLEGCKWNKVTVPGPLPRDLKPTLNGWMIYRTRFSAPQSCTQADSSCALFLAEVGDTVEAVVNGIAVGRHGEFPPKPIYAKHFPALFDLSRNLLRTGNDANELVLTVYSLKKVQAGVRQGPVAIYSSHNAYQVTQSTIAKTVFVPLLTAVCLFVIGVIGMIFALIQDIQDRKIHAYIRYCFATSLYLLSFSEIPREYLPIFVAGYIHTALKILSVWAAFEMVREYFEFKPWTQRYLRPLYWIALGIVGFSFLSHFFGDRSLSNGAGFDRSVLILRWSFPLFLLPPISGLIGSFGPKARRFRLYSALFFLLLIIFQTHDTLVLFGVISGSYFGKFYPLLIAITFGIYYIERSKEEWGRVVAERERIKHLSGFNQLITGLVHEFRAPAAGLAMACDQIAQNRENSNLLSTVVESLPSYTNRLLAVTEEIFDYSRDLTWGIKLNLQTVNLAKFLEIAIQEFRRTPVAQAVSIQSNGLDPSLAVSLDPVQMGRVLTNLLKNAAESCCVRDFPEIIVGIRKLSGVQEAIEISVLDNGPPIPDQIKGKLFQPFSTFGKDGGVGMGLAFCKMVVDAHKGSLEFRTDGEKAIVISMPLVGAGCSTSALLKS